MSMHEKNSNMDSLKLTLSAKLTISNQILIDKVTN